jgi:hypothetical protein
MSKRTRQEYPRSQPYHPPQELPDREARLRRWTLLLMLGTAASLGLTVALGLFFVARANRPGPEEAARKPARAETDRLLLSEAPLPPPSKLQLVNAGARSMPRAGQDPAVEEKIPPPSGPPAPDLRVPYERALQSLGGLTGSHLYQTYVNNGLLADLVEGDLYTEEDARELLAALAALMDLAEQQLQRLAEAGLGAEDQRALEHTRQVTALMRLQVKELTAYWERGDRENAERFHKARAEAWTGIKELLRIEE